MFVIFGWGKTTTSEAKNVIILKCSHCDNFGPWHAQRRTSWFTLFFVPIIPYKRVAFLYCEVCSRGFEITSRDFGKAQQLAGLYAALDRHELSFEDYRKAFNAVGLLDFSMKIDSPTVDATPTELPSPAGPTATT
jgi:hypothetical protein